VPHKNLGILAINFMRFVTKMESSTRLIFPIHDVNYDGNFENCLLIGDRGISKELQLDLFNYSR
jgi:hypothetical protein